MPRSTPVVCVRPNAVVSTTITQTFACETIDGEEFLRAELNLICDPSSARRQFWKNYAVIMLAVFPIGVPLLLVYLLVSQRARIHELMGEVIAETSVVTPPEMDMENRRRPRRTSHSIVLESELGFLARQFQKYKPGMHFTNVSLLVVRLLSTSMMVFFTDQASQVQPLQGHVSFHACHDTPFPVRVLDASTAGRTDDSPFAGVHGCFASLSAIS